MQKVIFALCLLLCFIPYSIIFAQDEDGTSDFDTLVTQYNLIPISQVPASIELIVIKDEQHLQQVMNRLSNPIVTYSESQSDSLYSNSVTHMTGTHPQTRSCSVNAGFAWFQHDATFYFNLSFPNRISSVWGRVSLQGVTFTLGLTDTSTSWWYNNSSQTSATARGEGTVNAYLLIQGGVLLWSERFGCNVSYP